MKKLILIALLYAPSIFSQVATNTITVIGETEKIVEVDRYHFTISLKEVEKDGYTQTTPKTLKQVKQLYSEKLKAIGIDFNNFHENIALGAYMSYSEVHDVVYYNYATTVVDDMKKVMDIKMNGLRIVSVEAVAKEKTNDELVTLTHWAIKNATVTAKKIANKLNKDLGDIIKIEDTNIGSQLLDYYRIYESQKHTVTVTFAIK